MLPQDLASWRPFIHSEGELCTVIVDRVVRPGWGEEARRIADPGVADG
jgi:hypothetical protein